MPVERADRLASYLWELEASEDMPTQARAASQPNMARPVVAGESTGSEWLDSVIESEMDSLEFDTRGGR